MNPPDSFQLDEHLARLLAAYEQGIDGGDAKAPTLGQQQLLPPASPLPGERAVTPMGGAANEVGLGEVLPDPVNTHPYWPPKSPPPPVMPPSGTHRVGRFELRRQLGKGGCGIVFLAYDPKLEREVALKIPRPEMLMSQDARRRLVREALAAAEFDHPNLVPVYETGEIGPICFIATAFCPGQTLGDWLDQQAFPVPVRQAARLVAIVAEAVQHAHDRGVLHRDLKPGNVILQPTKEDPNEEAPPPGSCQLRGDTYIPRVVDFGLAKLLERGGPSETGTRQILGTPKYMAPEQAQARHDDVGPAADVYALGVILYEMLTGRAPYEGASDVEVLRLAIEGHLTQPRHLRSDIPRDLEAICLKAMDRAPGRRYRTAIDLADDLRRFLDGKPTLARPLNWVGRAGRWLRRNDQAVALATVTLIALFFFTVWAWNKYSPPVDADAETNRREQDMARLRAEQQRDYSRNVREAFLAWRGGDLKTAAAALAEARRLARAQGEASDFTLGYLTRLVSAQRLHIICPAGAVSALAVSPDGTRLASGHADGTLALWNRATGEALGAIKAHDSTVSQVSFAMGGARLITVGRGSTGTDTALGWTLGPAGQITPASEPYRTLGSGVGCIAVSPDGNTVYTGSRTGQVRRFHLPNPADSQTVQTVANTSVRVLLATADGTGLLIGTSGGAVIRCSSSLQLPLEEAQYGGPVVGLLESGGQETVVGLPDGLFFTLDNTRFHPVRGRVQWLLPFVEGYVASESPGRVLVLSRRWSELVTGDIGEVRAGAITRDGMTLFTAGDDGVIRSWELPIDLRDQGAVSVGPVKVIGVHPDGHSFAVGTANSLTLGLGNPNEQAGPAGKAFAALRVIPESAAKATTLGVEFQGQTVIVSELGDNQKIVEKARFVLPDGATPISANLSGNGGRLAVGDDRGRVFVWNIAERSTLTSINCGYRRAVTRVELSDDGMLLAAPVEGNKVGLWVVGESTPRITVAAADPVVFRLIPGGTRLATAGPGGVVRIWDAVNGQEELALFGHVGGISGLGVSPDGRTLASGGSIGEVKLWDLRNGQELLGLRRHSGPVTVLEFAANGKLLVTGGTQIAVWETRE